MADGAQTNLRVRISADLADIKQGLGLLRGELAKVKREGATALPNSDAALGGIRRLKAELAGLAIGVSIGALFKGIIDNTKEAEDATAQLAAGLKSTGGVAGVTVPEIQKLAAELQKLTTYGDDTIVRMAAVVATFTNIRGAIFKDALPAILDMSTRLRVDLNSAAIQVGKALNDPIKGMTALGRAGVQFSAAQKEQIKHLVETNQLTKAQQIILRELTTEMGGSAAAAANTFAGSVDQLKNAFGDLLEGDSSSGGLSEAKTSIQGLTATLQEASTKAAFADLVTALAKGVSALATALREAMPVIALFLRNLDALAVFLGTRLAAGAIVAAIQGFIRLRAAIVAAREAMVALTAAELLVSGPVGLIIGAVAALATGVYLLATRTDEATKAEKAHKKAMEETRAMALLDRDAAIKDAMAKREQAIASLQAAKASLEEAKARATALNSVNPLGALANDTSAFVKADAAAKVQAKKALVSELQKQVDDVTKLMLDLAGEGLAQQTANASVVAATSTGDPKKKIKGVIDQAELAVDAIKRQQTALNDLFEHSKIKIADYFAEKQRLQLASIDAQIAQAQADAKAATSSDQQSKALTKIVELQRDRAEVGPRVAQEQKKAEEDLAKQLGDVYIRLLELQGKTVEARKASLEEEFKDLIVKLEAEADDAGVAIVRKLINTEAAKAQLDQFRSESDKVLGQLRDTESSLASQAAAGLLGGAEAERQIDVVRVQALQRLRDLREAALQYLQTLAPGSQEAQQTIAYLQQLQGEIGNVVAEQHQMLQQFEDSATSAFSQFLTDAALDLSNASEAARQFGLNIARALAQMASTEVAKRAIGGLKNLFGLGGQESSDVAAGAQIAAAAAAGTAYATPVTTASVALGTAGASVASAGTIIMAAAVQLQAAAATLLTANSIGAAARVAHGGGIIGSTVGRIRQGLSPYLFGNAPRYHTGGIAGLAPNEVPAILQRGEVVRTRQQEQALQSRLGGGSDQPARVIVVFSEDELADAMSGAAGERVTIAHVRRNRGGIDA